MKLRACFALVGAFLCCSHFELWASTTNPNVTSDEQALLDSEATEFNDLSAKAVEEGSAQVLVVLKDGLDEELPQDSGLPEAEQALIENEQDALLQDVPIRRTSSIKRFKHLPIIALSADENELKRLRASSHVVEIFEDKINFPASLDFSINKIGADVGWGLGYTGAGQTIAIIDNGVDKEHPFLKNKVVSEACFSTRSRTQKSTPTCRNRRKRDLSTGAASVKCGFQDNACTHGTLLAGIAAGNSLAPNFAGSGVAPEAKLIVVKADSLINSKKICKTARTCRVFFDSDLLRGLEFIYRSRFSFNIAAVNASLGGRATRQQCRATPIRKTVRKLRAANIAVIAASGNDGLKNRISSPGCIPGVISVGATNESDSVLSFSNNAASLTLLAPGKDIGLIMPGVVNPGFEVVASGTSLSAAQVSGAWATLKSQKPNATIDEILGTLIRTGVPSGDPRNSKIIKPRIQLNKALGI
jgi:subtilisin